MNEFHEILIKSSDWHHYLLCDKFSELTSRIERLKDCIHVTCVAQIGEARDFVCAPDRRVALIF